MSSLFLTKDEVEDLTGIKTGRNGIKREVLQCQFLRERGIPFTPNICGEPKIARAIIEGGKVQQSTPASWSPAVLNFQKRA